MTYIVCNHEWSFLEGEKKHSHTLKAGRHLFPFMLNLGGSLPSTLYTSSHGGASIAYKLRAVATRPGFANNLRTQRAVTLLRSPATGALEYQQSLEIENTWPEKVMYSIMVPHKAWAAGDDLTAVVKFSPLAKGVRVLSVVTTLNETTKLYSRLGWQESTKPVITARHEFRNGQAVWVEHQDLRQRSASSHQPGTRGHTHPGLAPSGPSTPACSTDQAQHSPPLPGHGALFFPGAGPLNDPPAPHSPEDGPSTSTPSPITNSEHGRASCTIPVDIELAEGDIATKLEISLPLCTTPTHTLEPVIISHRIRWSILIGNLDGHTSELRCSLPLHILDHRLLDEAKSATAQTRRLLFGGPEVPPEEPNPDLELPSYPSHIRDRIANMYLPDQAVLRVANPWIRQGISPVLLDSDQDGGRQSGVTSGTHTPLEAHYVSSPVGHGQGDPGLEYLNSELLLSLSQHAPPPPIASPTESAPSSRSVSRRPSRVASRAQSRAPSPDRGRVHERESEPSQQQLHSRRSSSGTDAAPSTYLHENNAASRNVHGLFHTTMKPLTSLTSSFTLPTRHYTFSTPPSSHIPPPVPPLTLAHTHAHPRYVHGHGHPGTTNGGPQSLPASASASASASATAGAAALPRMVPVTSHSLLHRAFTEVPDYGIASRGFLGGVTPLETMQGLPSYEESAATQRSRSESDLASMAAGRRGPRFLNPLVPLRTASPGAAVRDS
jgi:arrestin-related trafficking adapter 4/5/7